MTALDGCQSRGVTEPQRDRLSLQFRFRFFHARRGVCGDRLFSAGASPRTTGAWVSSVHRMGGFHIRPFGCGIGLGAVRLHEREAPSHTAR